MSNSTIHDKLEEIKVIQERHFINVISGYLMQ